MTTTNTPRRPHAPSISRTLGRILDPQRHPKNARNGWTVRTDGPHPRVIITLNHFNDADDHAALNVIRKHLSDRYTLTYTPVLADYTEFPEDLNGCAIIEITTLPTPPETPAMPETPTVTVTLPGRFCDFLEGTGMIEGDAPESLDADSLATRTAFRTARRRNHAHGAYSMIITTDNTAVLDILEEYTEYCQEANHDDGDPKETAAARTASDRIRTARTQLRALQTTTPAPATETAPQTPAARVDWTKTVRGHHNGTLTLPGGAVYKIAHVPGGTAADHIAHDSGHRRVARTWGLPALIAECAAHAGIPTPAHTEEHGRHNLTR
ncbi:hypothetical protein [Streptomyces sp. NPDC088752]|uniref:hypothetical protein n=1 Tax=Streptomyces sp. NPDC088752 TaxID=3154963 RepID=UPI00342FD983